MRKILGLLLVVCLANGVFAQKTALQILDASYEKFSKITSFKAEFTQSIKNAQGIDESNSGSIAVKGEKFLAKLGDQVVISNGKKRWTYFQDLKEVNINCVEDGEENAITPKAIAGMYKKGYKYLLKPEETIGGKTHYVVDLSPDLTPEQMKTNQVFKIRIWIDKSTNMIKKWKIFEKNGNRFTTTVNKIELNPTISDDEFEYSKKKYPADEVIDFSDDCE